MKVITEQFDVPVFLGKLLKRNYVMMGIIHHRARYNKKSTAVHLSEVSGLTIENVYQILSRLKKEQLICTGARTSVEDDLRLTYELTPKGVEEFEFLIAILDGKL